MLPHIHRATQKFYIFLIVYLTGCTPIPSSVVSIENYAFANCKNLKTIEIRTTKLKNKKISSKAFKKINKKVVIRVLKKQRKAYKTLLRKKGLSKANKFKAL